MQVWNGNKEIGEIVRPRYAIGHVHPGEQARIEPINGNCTQRGFDGEHYYDAWYQIDGELFFPVGDPNSHAPLG